jgi:Tfp pilus assembly protein PilE
MGQQQLLLIVLGIIIVGIAIAVGVNMFQSSAVDTNRQSMISDLANLAAKAQRYYRTPTELGGGAQDFQNFALGRLDTANANGSYRLSTATSLSADAVPAPTTANTSIATSVTDTIYILGWGKEMGDIGTFPVKAQCAVSPTGISTQIVN